MNVNLLYGGIKKGRFLYEGFKTTIMFGGLENVICRRGLKKAFLLLRISKNAILLYVYRDNI